MRGRLMVLSEDKEMSFLNKLLILAVLGWLFQVVYCVHTDFPQRKGRPWDPIKAQY